MLDGMGKGRMRTNMSINNSDRYYGDGSADREALTRHTEDVAGPRAPMPSAAEIEARNADIARRMRRCTIEGFRAAATHHAEQYASSRESYYRLQWRAWRNIHGADSVRQALMTAAHLDGVQLRWDER